MESLRNKWLRFILPILIACVSIFGLSKFATSVSFHQGTIEALDAKAETVMTLTAASTGASAAISLIPGDTATPIAEKLADLSTYFLLALCAIYLEKYLLTITGYATFIILIPLGCALYAYYALKGKESIKFLARKVMVFGLALFLVVPASVKVSGMIEATYKDQIEQTVTLAQDTAKEVEEHQDDSEWSFTEFLESISNGIKTAAQGVQTILNNFIEALAVILVTSVAIPLIVLLFFVWLIKTILSVNFDYNLKIGKAND